MEYIWDPFDEEERTPDDTPMSIHQAQSYTQAALNLYNKEMTSMIPEEHKKDLIQTINQAIYKAAWSGKDNVHILYSPPLYFPITRDMFHAINWYIHQKYSDHKIERVHPVIGEILRETAPSEWVNDDDVEAVVDSISIVLNWA